MSSTVIDSPTERLVIAERFRVTNRQRIFAEAYASDPTRNKSAAARACGYREDIAAERGCRMYQNPKVRQYIDFLIGEALAQSDVADPHEVMASISKDMRYRGKDWRRREKAQDKMARVHKLYETDDGKPVTVNVTLQQVLKEDPKLVVDIAMRLLKESKDQTR